MQPKLSREIFSFNFVPGQQDLTRATRPIYPSCIFSTSHLFVIIFNCHMNLHTYVLPLREVGMSDVAIAGGKNASLGEMITNLQDMGIRIPDGFVITVHAY